MSAAPPIRYPSRSSIVGEDTQIRRALPNRERRMVGAWCFLDHLGPAQFAPGKGMHVGPHPHIGLQTFTWMIEGEVIHRDSLGYEQVIRPGQVNLMTAGRGISHTEDSAQPGAVMHAAQLWIALPDSHRHIAPRFQHYPDLPQMKIGDFDATVLAGEALGLTAPAQVHTPLMSVDLHASGQASPAKVQFPLRADFEHAVMSLSGQVMVEGETLPEQDLIYLPAGRESVNIECSPDSRLLIIGGEPMDEAILLWWNFVARTTEEMQEAQAQWEAEAATDAETIDGKPRRFGPPVASALKSLHSPSLEGVVLKASR